MIPAMTLMSLDSAQPMYTVPPVISGRFLNSSSVLSTSERMSSARFRRSIPSSVSRTEWLLRTKSFRPSSVSSSLICFESAGCVTCTLSAAREMFCSLAASRKYLSVLISMSFPRRCFLQ